MDSICLVGYGNLPNVKDFYANFQLTDIEPKLRAPLDPGFRPSWCWQRAYQKEALANPQSSQVQIAIGRPDGSVSHFSCHMLPETTATYDVNLRFLDRVVKFLLWARGGSKVWIAGAPETAAALQLLYAPGGARAFDADFMGTRIFLDPFQIHSCSRDDLPEESGMVAATGGGLNGCRIGFDLGGSDRKAAALINGEVVFSEEIPWDPYFQKDPSYHEEGIRDSLRRAAQHLPRVDAIGGSAAGVYVDNEPRVASLFRGVPQELFADRVRPIFKKIAAEWGVPLVVANDGDVTALAAARMLGDSGATAGGGVLGLALGTSLAAGYVSPNGSLTTWLNELAFVPVDHRSAAEGGHVDEWSGDAGTGARYLSQQALLQLLPATRSDINPDLSLPEKLVQVQAAMAAGLDWAIPIYETYGVYLGYAVCHFAEFYDFNSLLVLGRVASGEGGTIMLSKARDVIQAEAPELAEHLTLITPDETFKRHGQAIAAASLPIIEPTPATAS